MMMPFEAEEHGGFERSETIDFLRKVAHEIGTTNENPLLAAVATWLDREAHLAVRRASEMMADGIPVDTAFFGAVDDMGFQVAHAAAQGWGVSKEADCRRE